MIARIFILILLGIILPDLYIDRHYLRRHKSWWKRVLWWTPSVLLLAATVFFTLQRHFIPEEPIWLYAYLFAFGVLVLPKLFFALCSSLGLLVCKLLHKRMNWGNLIGWVLALFSIYMVCYGSFVGHKKLEVKHIELTFQDLPEAFDGYRIVHFSDAHVGTFSGSLRELLQRDIDSINAQQADLIVFTGDLQNLQPSEVYPMQELLSSLKAKDGVCSVLGNHDYATYIDSDPIIKTANEREIISREQQFGWNLLLNSHQPVVRDDSRIIIAGEENDGEGPFPAKGDLKKTLEGTDSADFIIMLQHDPSAWRRSILPHSHAQLTLSGHTHGGQLSLFGLRGTQLVGKEDFGLYKEDGRYLYVTCGIGSVLPFRFGVTPEIVVFTLRTKK